MTLKLSLGNGYDEQIAQRYYCVIRSKVKVTMTFTGQHLFFYDSFEIVLIKLIRLGMNITHDL